MKTLNEYLNESVLRDSGLNATILRFLKKVAGTKNATGGHEFEENLYADMKKFFEKKYGNKFVYKTTRDKNISVEKNSKELKISNTTKKNSSQTSYDPSCLYMIPQPNGGQSWPDLALVYNNKVIPFELKSGKTGTIMWNSGFPVENCVYIYNNYTTGETILFMGKDRADTDLVTAKEEFSKALYTYSKELLAKPEFSILKEQKINYFLRDMWEDTMNYSKSDKKKEWMSNVEQHISSFAWE